MEPRLTATPDRIAALPDHTASIALSHLVEQLAGVFHANLLLLSDSDEVEPVHKARVTLRRFRAVVTAFEPVLDEDLAEALHDRSRALFRVLGGIRDADVMAARFAETRRAAEMAKEAVEQRRRGRKLLKRKKAAGFRDWAVKRLAGKTWRRTGKKAKALRDAPVAVLANAALDRAWDTCVSNGTDLHVMSARAQHDLRKDLKMLRYLSEAFADLWPGTAQDAFLVTLRNLQDDLGELTDSALARSLGHPETPDPTDPKARAAEDWTALLRQGPWWV